MIWVAVEALLEAALATVAVVVTVTAVDKAISIVKEKTKREDKVAIIYSLGSGNGTNLIQENLMLLAFRTPLFNLRAVHTLLLQLRL